MSETIAPSIYAFGLGLRRSKGSQTLDVLYPKLAFASDLDLLAQIAELLEQPLVGNQFYLIPHEVRFRLAELCQGTRFESLTAQLLNQVIAQPFYGHLDVILYVLQDPDQAVQNPEEAYFKLHLLSQRLVEPHGVNLTGAFGVLQNLAWTQKGPVLPEDLDEERLKALLQGEPLLVSHVDKFPYLVNYHVPTGVRIAAGSQVRLGAYLGAGTTVMPAGYVNFNAGTAGHAMVEGRISAGVFVGENTDIGGGASIMGTLSGGNQHVISIGPACLLGANSGTGISLGYGCTIAAGLYLYAGMKVSLYDAQGQPVNVSGKPVTEGENIVKALALSGRDRLLFIQDSQTGKVICKPNPRTIELNTELHQHN